MTGAGGGFSGFDASGFWKVKCWNRRLIPMVSIPARRSSIMFIGHTYPGNQPMKMSAEALIPVSVIRKSGSYPSLLCGDRK